MPWWPTAPAPPERLGYGSPIVIDPTDPGDAVLGFLTEPHLATLSTVRSDGRLHSVPVGFTYDPAERLVRIITLAGSVKVRNIARGSRAAVCQVDGGRWLTLEGSATVTDDPERTATAVDRYGQRYRPPVERADRVAIEIDVDHIMGNA